MTVPAFTRVVRNEMRTVPCACPAGPCGWRHYQCTGYRVETTRRDGETWTIRRREEVS